MTFKEQEKITKNTSEELLTELINYQGDNLMGEIVRLGLQQLMGREFSSMAISRFASTLDTELDSWRERSLKRDFPYVVVDARYESCRVDGKVIDIAVLIAIGIDSDGYRHVLGLETAWGETSDSWDRFISGLKQRGLKGVRLFTSDDHPGIHPAIKKHYPGAVWQRCQRHFSKNALDLVPKSRREDLYDRLKAAWDAKEYEKARGKLDEISEVYQDKYPELAELISEHGWETLGVYNAAPVEHHKRLRTTNMIERVNQELKRRSKVVRIFPNTSSCRRLFSALLKEWHEDWVHGRKYLDMEELWEFEKNKPNLQQVRGPVVDLSIVKEEKSTVV